MSDREIHGGNASDQHRRNELDDSDCPDRGNHHSRRLAPEPPTDPDLDVADGVAAGDEVSADES